MRLSSDVADSGFLVIAGFTRHVHSVYILATRQPARGTLSVSVVLERPVLNANVRNEGFLFAFLQAEGGRSCHDSIWIPQLPCQPALDAVQLRCVAAIAIVTALVRHQQNQS